MRLITIGNFKTLKDVYNSAATSENVPSRDARTAKAQLRLRGCAGVLVVRCQKHWGL